MMHPPASTLPELREQIARLEASLSRPTKSRVLLMQRGQQESWLRHLRITAARMAEAQ